MIPCKQCPVYARCISKKEITCKLLGKWLRNQIRLNKYIEAKEQISSVFNQFILNRSDCNTITKLSGGMEIHLKMNNEATVKSNQKNNE